MNRITRFRLRAIAAAVVGGLFSLQAMPAVAATITVSSSCSLQNAVIAANADSTSNGCPAGDPGLDTIELPVNSTQTFSAAQAGGDPNSGLTISSPIVINGHGSTITRASNSPGARLVRVVASGDLTLNDLTLTGGFGFPGSDGGGGGGGLLNNGSLTLNRCTVSGNFALPDGGGLYNYGTLALTNSTVSGNSANGYGGGLSNLGTLTLTNSTVSGNTAAFDGGGIANGAGSTTLIRSLIAGNFAPNRREVTRTGGSVTANNRNLFGAAGETNAMAFNGFTPGASDVNATSSGPSGGIALSNILSPLAENGGPTRTHALPTGSPAINAAGSVCPATDQRGVKRPQGGGCDIGAFEVGTNTADLAIIGSASPSPAVVGGSLVFTFNVSNLGPDTAIGVQLVDTLPATLSFVSANPVAPATGSCANDSGSGSGSGSITCALGNLALNQIVRVAIAVTANSTGTVNNTASVLSDITDTDIDPSSNASTVSVLINPADTVPDQFRFVDVSDVPLNSVQTSNSVTITGINAPAAMSVTGGQYSIGCSEAGFTASPGTVVPGATVCVRMTSSAHYGTEKRVSLNIGGIVDRYSTTTLTRGTKPTAFRFFALSNVARSSINVSNPVTPEGLTTATPISVTDGQYSIGCTLEGLTANPGTIEPGQMVCVLQRAAPSYSTAKGTELTVGSATARFTTTTITEPAP